MFLLHGKSRTSFNYEFMIEDELDFNVETLELWAQQMILSVELVDVEKLLESE